MATRKNILKACFVAALSVGLAACGSSTTEVVNTPPSLVLGGNAVIDEGMTGGTGLTVTATDEQGDTITYDVSDERFRVMGGMLVVVAGTMLDYETERSIAVDITASDGALSSDTKTANVMVSNVDDEPLTLSTSGTRGHIVEGKTGGTGLTFMVDDNDDMPENLRFSVHDEETDANLDEFFEVIKLGEGRYELGVKEGKELDREMDEEVQVVVTATDGHGRPEMTPTLTIVVGNVNDTDPKLGMEVDTGEILEGMVGSTGVYFHPTDDDGDTMLTLDILGDNRDSFDVVPVVRDDERSGYELQVKKAFDFETVGDTVKVVVAVKDSVGDVDKATIDVMVRDVNDNAPIVTTMGSAAIDEEKTGSTMLKVGVMDADSDSVGVDPVWTVYDDRFTIDADGYLVLNEAIDYDGPMGAMSVDVEVMANDGDNNSDRMTVTVTINPVNDNAPVIKVDGTQAELNEGRFAAAMDTGVTVSVEDKDGGDMESLMVDDSRFTIADDGSLMIAAGSMFDYEKMEDRSITLTITASDGTNKAMAQTAVVEFMNVNDNKPVLEVTHNQGGPALKVVTRDEGLVSANTPTGHKVKVEDADTDTPLIQWAVVSDKERFYIDEDGYLMIKAGSVFDFEEEDDKIIKLEITANDGKNDAEDPYTITFNIADVDEPPMIAGVKKPELVMGPYGDGHVVTTLTAVDPDDPDTPFAVKWEEVTKDDHDGTVWEWKDNAQGDKYVLSMKSGTFLGIGGPTADSHNREDSNAAYTGYTADNAGTLRRHVVDVDDAELNERASIQVHQKADQVETSDALKMYSIYTVEPTDRHKDGATVGEGEPGNETFVPSFDHLTNIEIDSADSRLDSADSRLLSDFEILRGIKIGEDQGGGGSGFKDRSTTALLSVFENSAVSTITADNIDDWYETSMVSPLNPVPTEPMALDIVTDTRSVDIKTGEINEGHELAIRYRWSSSGMRYNEDVALIDGSRMVLEEYRDGGAYTDRGYFGLTSEGTPRRSVEQIPGESVKSPETPNSPLLPIRVDVIGAEATEADEMGEIDVMSYAKFGLWSYNNTRECNTCPDDGLRGATAFGLKARPEDLRGQDHVGVWKGTTVAFWGDVNPDDSSVDPKTLGFNGKGDATITVNFDTNSVNADMDVANHMFNFIGMLDGVDYTASIDTTVPGGIGSIGGTGMLMGDDDLPSGHDLSKDSSDNIHAKGSLNGAFYGPSIPKGSTIANARASAETAGTWQITDVPNIASPEDAGTIVIGAFGAGLQENTRAVSN